MRIDKVKTINKLKEFKQYEYNYNYCSESLSEELAKIAEMMEVVETAISDSQIVSIIDKYGYKSESFPIYKYPTVLDTQNRRIL